MQKSRSEGTSGFPYVSSDIWESGVRGALGHASNIVPLGVEVEPRGRINDGPQRNPTEVLWEFWPPPEALKNEIRQKNTTSERGIPGPRNIEVSLFFLRDLGIWGGGNSAARATLCP